MRPEFLEFFAGIGLVHIGLNSSGWRCIYANDISEKKKEMYLHEMPDAFYYHCEDIWKTDAIVERIKKPALLATASFPCIDLSLAGNMKGIKGEHSSTFYGFVEIMQRLKSEGRMPPMLMLENVTGLFTGNGGKDFNEVCLAASELGFYLDSFVIDAKHFTPQSRPRLFILGMVEEILPSNITRHWETNWWDQIQARTEYNPSRFANAMKDLSLPTGWIAFDLPPLPPIKRNITSIIDLDNNQEWWDEEAVRKHLEMTSDLHQQRINKMMGSRKLWIGTMFRRVREGKTRAEMRFDGLAGCLRTAKGGSAKQAVIVIDSGTVKMRWMSPVEYARLQGVPHYPIRVRRNQALTGFADAVCVPVIEWIDHNILSPIASSLGFELEDQKPLAFNTRPLSLFGNV